MIVCIECMREWKNPRERWRILVDCHSSPSLRSYCPACARRKFKSLRP